MTEKASPTTVAEFVAWLQTQDQEAEVNVLVGYESFGWGGDSYRFQPLEIAEHTEYSDLRGNPYTKPEAAHYNKRYLYIGQEA